MDGTKRKAHTSPAPADPSLAMVDLGATPPWSLPPSYHEESALRSTLQSSPESTINPSALHQPTSTETKDVPLRSPLENYANTYLTPQTRKKIGKGVAESTGASAPDQDDDADVHIDTESDGVYMVNVGEGSWSGSLPSEDDPDVQQQIPLQAELALKHLRRAQELSNQQARLTAANIAMEALLQERETKEMTPEDEAKWQRDLLLQNTVRQIKKRLREGAVLTLERLGPVNLTMMCAHPFCPATGKITPAGAYYVILSQPDRSGSIIRYCLICLEVIWDGKGLAGAFPEPQVDDDEKQARQKINSFSLDGTMDEARLRAAGLQSTPLTWTPGSSISTPSSMWSPANGHAVPTPPTNYSSAATPTVATSADDLADRTLDSTSIYDSPLLRKSKSRKESIEREDERFLKSEESFKDKINRASSRAQRTEKPAQPVRRSTRLISTSTSGSSTPSTPTGRSSLVKQDRSALSKAKRSSIDTIADEIKKADARLEVMYEQLEKALPLLNPGEKIMIRHPRGGNSKATRFTRMDVFGFVYTDLLADHVKYSARQPVEDNLVSPKLATHTGASLTPKAVRSPTWRTRSRGTERWCVCHGVEDGREMILCGNEKCLVGWHHIDCVGADIGEDDEWICPLCTSQQAGQCIMPPLTTDPKILKSFFDPPFAGRTVYDIENSAVVQEDNHSRIEEDEQDSYALRFDGASDPQPLPYQPPKPTPLKQTHFQIPESLLSSKHAPSPEELLSYSPEQTNPVPPTPPLPETPGSPQSTQDSITSTGEWRHPPTRFQHLAKFMRAGNSLNETEKAAVELWKAASAEQVHWIGFRRKYEETMRELANVGDDRTDEVEVIGDVGEVAAAQQLRNSGDLGRDEVRVLETAQREVGSLETDNEGEEENGDGLEKDLESTAGLLKSQCRGRNLTWVLAEIHSRETQSVD